MPQTATLIPLLRRDGMSDGDVNRVFSTFNVAAFAAERSKQ
ncbi:coenzyme F420-reducing hydrogenase, gamma subunit domain protein [Mycobacterium kansasii]|uniref:Coenzyme F420-reducing hydrogenase, gamma subunit domain protein n=1 Tax=Mycobacterium kansasii TaxID=1768 RepID=A0A1V3WNK3_MYCKA|nr:coenzyme F420-reducing hydrogenase, gamma subunit domain protein [Mycobacterium kansasii]